MPEEPKKLISAAANGDSAALEKLLHRYLPGLHAFVRLRTGGVLRERESASDLVQSTCREILEHLDRFQFRGEAGFKDWLYTTALRKIANRNQYYRAAKRDPDREELIDLGAVYRSVSTPSEHVAAAELQERMEEAFAQLPEDFREVILLDRLIGLPRAEIAERMGRTDGALRTLLSRALAELADLMERPEQ